ncbi:MAG: CdaR family protein [Ignavibacteria bacterium]|nr:CdaR family protein [Ignavibacteria bacterium]
MKKEYSIFIIFVFIAFIFWGTITLSDEYSVTLDVPIKIVVSEINYAVEDNIPDKFEIKVRTTGWEILKLKYFQIPKIEIVVNEPVENFIFHTSSITNEQLGLSSNAKIISIKPERIKLNFNLSTEKKVKIYPRIVYSLKEGYEIVTPIKVEPETVIIKGTRRVLSQIDSLPTETVQLPELSEFVELQTSLIDTLNNLITYSKTPVKIFFDVQQIADRSFENIPVELINVPKNKDLILFPSYIDLKLRGGIKILGTLSPDSIKAFVDYNKYLSDDDKIIPEFDLPYGVRVIEYFPKQFKLIERK